MKYRMRKRHTAVFQKPEWMYWLSSVGVRSHMCCCLVTWFCFHLTAKPGNKTAATSIPDLLARPGNKTAAPSWPDPYLYSKEGHHGLIKISKIFYTFWCVTDDKGRCNYWLYACDPARDALFLPEHVHDGRRGSAVVTSVVRAGSGAHDHWYPACLSIYP